MFLLFGRKHLPHTFDERRLKALITLMCDFHILHHNAHGYVVKCPGCKTIKMAFGSVAFSMTLDQFYEFQTLVRLHYGTHSSCIWRGQKRAEIPTANPAITLIYSLEELEALSDLMNEAELALEIERLLNVPDADEA